MPAIPYNPTSCLNAGGTPANGAIFHLTGYTACIKWHSPSGSIPGYYELLTSCKPSSNIKDIDSCINAWWAAGHSGASIPNETTFTIYANPYWWDTSQPVGTGKLRCGTPA